MFSVFLKPLDLFVTGLGYFCYFVMWWWICLSPLLGFSLIGGFLFLAFDSFWLLGACIGIGFVLGVYWAEKVRREVGCMDFMGKLLSTPEIDGYLRFDDHRFISKHNRKMQGELIRCQKISN